jgi:hypothetical protein
MAFVDEQRDRFLPSIATATIDTDASRLITLDAGSLAGVLDSGAMSCRDHSGDCYSSAVLEQPNLDLVLAEAL